MAIQLQLKHEDERELRFAYPWGWGIVALPASAALFYASLGASLFLKLVLIAAGLLMLLAGLRGMFWRDELLLDCSSRTFTRRTGLWPSVKMIRGSLDEVKRLALGFELQSGRRGGRIPTWILSLQFRDSSKDVSIAQFRNEAEAYRKLESWSRKLSVPQFDETRPADYVTPVEVQPHRRAPVPAGENRIPSLPQGTQIVFVTEGPERRILLPRGGFTAGAVIFALFPAVLLYMGILEIISARQPVTPGNESSVFIMFAVAALMIAALCFGIFGRDAIQEQGRDIRVGKRAFGFDYNVKTLPKNEIDSVEIRDRPLSGRNVVITGPGTPAVSPRATGARQELFIRSRNQVLRIGANVSAEDREWLRQALMSLAAS